MQVDTYSRVVAFLKVVLPLTALAILSTLFLVSRAIDPSTSIPFADTELQERLRDQQVTGPFFAGTTADGDQIAFMADRLTTLPDEPGSNRAENVFARLDLTSGTRITLRSDFAAVNMPDDHANLTGRVVVTTSTGYEVTTDEIISRMSRLDVQSLGTVLGEGPLGTFTAGHMHLVTPEPDADSHLVFTNGVELLYQPRNEKD